MEFVTFEDDSSLYETTLFPDIYRRFYHLLVANRPFVVEGRVEADMGALTIDVQKIGRLDTARSTWYDDDCYGPQTEAIGR